MIKTEQRFGIIIFLPTLILMTFLVFYPLFESFRLSFYAKDTLTLKGGFIGFSNYIYILKSPEFWRSLYNGIIFTLGSLTLQIPGGVAIALLLHRTFRGRNVIRGLVLFPYLLPVIVSTLTWKWMLNDLYGIINYFLTSIRVLKAPISWLGTPGIAMMTIIVIGAWQFTPFVIICVLSRLQVIPIEHYEAAKVDGAGALQRFFHITLPQLKGVLTIVIFLRGIWMFNKFDIIWLLTKGGPAKTTMHLPIYTYMTAFSELNFGKGCASAVFIFIILAIVGWIYFKILEGKTSEEY
jgi:multiple sugar transport system permease protein